MNIITLKGIIKNIERSHTIQGITYDKAKLIVKRDNGSEDIINLKFKKFSNHYVENEEVSLTGNLRSYSYKVSESKNKVVIYVFTYFDQPEDDTINSVEIDGRICKIDNLRTTKQGKNNIHLILANNIICEDNDSSKRLNSYIPCIAWGKLARELSKLDVSTKISVKGKLHSREHRKVHENGEVELCVAHELLVSSFKVIE